MSTITTTEFVEKEENTVAITFRPAEVFPPGDFLREELEERRWTQADLAEVMGRPLVLVNEIVTGKRSISAETAKGLAAALGTSPELWMRLESGWQLWKARNADEDSVAQRARVYERAPIREMTRRGWLTQTRDVRELERQLLAFLDVDKLNDQFALRHAAAKGTSYAEALTPTQEVCLARAWQLAPTVHANPWNPARATSLIDRVKPLLESELEVRHVPRLLADAGIRFVIVQPLPGSKLDGATFWLSQDAPVIAMTLRLDRIDNFWFVLLHELKHVFSHDAFVVDDDLLARVTDDNLPLHERQAVRFAVETLIPQDELEKFIARVRPLYSAQKVSAFAARLQVHPALVVGQLQSRGELDWSQFRRTLVPIRQILVPNAATDGWGQTLPSDL